MIIFEGNFPHQSFTNPKACRVHTKDPPLWPNKGFHTVFDTLVGNSFTIIGPRTGWPKREKHKTKVAASYYIAAT